MDSPLSWQDEAQAVIRDVKASVNEINVSSKLDSNEHHIYLNLVTLENRKFCIELSPRGFRVVGNQHDTNDLYDSTCYDTPYALLSEISQSYTDSFANALISKLEGLSNET